MVSHMTAVCGRVQFDGGCFGAHSDVDDGRTVHRLKLAVGLDISGGELQEVPFVVKLQLGKGVPSGGGGNGTGGGRRGKGEGRELDASACTT